MSVSNRNTISYNQSLLLQGCSWVSIFFFYCWISLKQLTSSTCNSTTNLLFNAVLLIKTTIVAFKCTKGHFHLLAVTISHRPWCKSSVFFLMWLHRISDHHVHPVHLVDYVWQLKQQQPADWHDGKMTTRSSTF